MVLQVVGKERTQGIKMAVAFTDNDSKQNHELAQELAKELKGQVGQVNCWSFIINLGGESGVFVNTQDKRKYAVYGLWPTDSKKEQHIPYDDRPQIGVSKVRGIKVLATEIKNRFLPEYLPLYKEMCTRVQEANANHAKAKETEKTLQILFGATVTSRGGIYIDGDYGVHKVHIGYAGKVSLATYELPPETAYKVLAVLRDNPT